MDSINEFSPWLMMLVIESSPSFHEKAKVQQPKVNSACLIPAHEAGATNIIFFVATPKETLLFISTLSMTSVGSCIVLIQYIGIEFKSAFTSVKCRKNIF